MGLHFLCSVWYAVLGSFLATLNLFCEERYGISHDLDEFFAYDFMKVRESACRFAPIHPGQYTLNLQLLPFSICALTMCCRYGSALKKRVCGLIVQCTFLGAFFFTFLTSFPGPFAANHRVHAFFESVYFNDGIPTIPGALDTLRRLSRTSDLVVVT